MKISFTCRRLGCEKTGERYQSQIRSDKGAYCSYECRGADQAEAFRGSNNPNYKSGEWISDSKCECGNLKDSRSKNCASCANKGRSRYTDDEIAQAIINTRNFMEAADLLNINRKTVQRVAWERNIKGFGGKRLKNPNDILNKTRFVRIPHIARYVKKHNLLPYNCAKCDNNGSWQGEALVLQLDHINGDPLNNRIENLQWLCPNCHSQTDTFCGKNVKRGGEANDHLVHE